MKDLRVLGFAGSLREGSWNRALLEAAREMAPAGMAISVSDLSGIPLYNADQDNDDNRPESVNQFKQAIADADAVLIATPEYNYSIPGVLKNAIDWASRPGMRSVFAGKPVAMMGASSSMVGTARAQAHLRLVILSMKASVLPHPDVLVARAKEKFDDQHRLTDEMTRKFLKEMLERLLEWGRHER
jgi:chromate reductase